MAGLYSPNYGSSGSYPVTGGGYPGSTSELAQPGDGPSTWERLHQKYPNTPAAMGQALQDSGYTPAQIEAYLESLNTQQQAYIDANGQVNRRLDAQIQDAKDALAQSKELAYLSDRTQRYGVDVASRDRIAALNENMRQFDANHGLEYAKAATDYLSSPDRFAQATDFIDMAGRAEQGLGPRPYGTDTTFTPKTEDDFKVLSNYGQSYGSGDPSQYSTSGGGGSGGGSDSGGGSGGGQDPRVKVLHTMMKHMPPSEGDGMTGNDYKVMQAAQSLYSTNLKPGVWQKMRPDQKAIYGSYIKRSGRSLNDYASQQTRQAIGQGSSNRAA